MGKSSIDWVRRSARIIRMVGELHRLGYQQLRIMPFNGQVAYRIAIAPATLFAEENGSVCMHRENELCIQYSAASGANYFEWNDAKHDDARSLAYKFARRFPGTAAAGEGFDFPYAGWLVALLGYIEDNPTQLPVVEEELGAKPSSISMFDVSGRPASSFPLPPTFNPHRRPG